MRILILNKRAPFEGRGAEQVIWKIGKRFAEAGHQVRFFCPNPGDPTAVPDIDGVEFSFVTTSADATRGMIEFFVRGPRRYRSVYQEFEPDIVYDNPSPFPFHIAHLYGNAPVVNKVHAIYRSDAFACKDHPLVQLGTVLGEETYRLFRNEYFITNSDSTATRLTDLVNLDANTLIANPIGIDASEFAFHVPDSSKRVVTISKLSPRKRIGDLLRAWKQVEAAYPDASLVVAGSGPLSDNLHLLRDELGIQNVSFPGYVSDIRKRNLLREAAVFVSPTLFEGFGLTNLEAMASGCAVVTTDTWGVQDYMKDGKNGRVVPLKSPTALAEAISTLISNHKIRINIAHVGRETAESYSMEESLHRELQHLTEIVSE